MSKLLGLRPYQQQGVEAVEAAWGRGLLRPALVMATGTGKTRTATHVIARHLERNPGGRAVFLVHRDELAVQSSRDFAAYGLETGVVMGAADDVDAAVVVAGVQTLARPNRLERLKGVTLVVVDECHHAAARTYREVLTGLGCFGGGAVALGLTATMHRSDGNGLGAVWDEVVYRYDILDGIASGYLCDVSGRAVMVEGFSLSEAKMSGGDFALGSLSDMLTSTHAQQAVLAAYDEHARDMPGLVFTPTVATAYDFAAAFAGAGYSVEVVHGEMDRDERRRVMDAYRDGEVQILVNCQILTEGTDLPRAQCAVIARPTTSPSLYIQMVGRVLRPFPGKDKALVLDVGGISADHRLATLADLSSRRISEVRPGESLREAAAREVKARSPLLEGYVLNTEEVDLFHRSRSVWLQTHKGLWFVPCGNAVAFLWPGTEPDVYKVGIRALSGPGGKFLQRDIPLDIAMEWGEQHAEEYLLRWQEANGKTFQGQRNAAWRKGKPSRDALRMAENMGINVPEGARAGELSCIIDIERASRVLDPKLEGREGKRR